MLPRHLKKFIKSFHFWDIPKTAQKWCCSENKQEINLAGPFTLGCPSYKLLYKPHDLAWKCLNYLWFLLERYGSCIPHDGSMVLVYILTFIGGISWWDPWHTINIAAPLGSVMGTHDSAPEICHDILPCHRWCPQATPEIRHWRRSRPRPSELKRKKGWAPTDYPILNGSIIDMRISWYSSLMYFTYYMFFLYILPIYIWFWDIIRVSICPLCIYIYIYIYTYIHCIHIIALK